MRILILTLIFSSKFLFSQECDCKKNFNWLKETLAQNDAGYQLSIDKKGKEYFEFITSNISAKAKKTNSFEVCEELLKEWLTFFRKGHLFIVSNKEIEYNALKNITLNTEQFKQRVKKNPEYLDGIWRGNGYVLAIKENEAKNSIQGIVISSENPKWKKGDIKFHTNFDFTQGVYFSNNRQKIEISYLSIITKGIIQIDNFYFQKVFPSYSFSDQERTFLDDINAKSTVFKNINNKTSYIKIPTFANDKRNQIKEIIDKNLDTITNKENLIIDLRGNQGGSDYSFSPLLRIIYTNPIVSMGILHYSSELNNKNLEERLDFDTMDEEDKKWYTNKLKEASKNIGKFIDVHGMKYGTTTLDSIYTKPNKVYIIVDNFCASSTEEFLLKAKQSNKVKVFGVPTAGALDVSNLNAAVSPTNDFKLIYATSKSLRMPTLSIDDNGIQPDYFIHKYIPKHKWVEYILRFNKE